MPRWATSIDEIRHISQISQEIPIGGLVLMRLMNDTLVEGVLVRSHQGNNGGEGGWKYYGEVEILTKDSKRAVIDYLDIKHAKSAWSEEKSREYEALGLIKIVDFPTKTN